VLQLFISLPRVVRLRRPGSLSSVLSGGGELGPARLQERAHAVARLAHRRVVLVERLAVVENHSDVGAELFSPFVPAETNEHTPRSAKFCSARPNGAKKKRQAFIRSEMQVLVKLLLSLLLVRESIKARKMNELRDLMQSFFQAVIVRGEFTRFEEGAFYFAS
jgi:hypothetical protein